MRISPLDVRSQDFRKSLRGYDPEEVRAFLDAIADTMEDILKEKETAEADLIALKTKVEAFTEMEISLRDAMVAAQKAGDEARVNAQRNAELMIREAELEVRQRIADAKRRVDDIFRTRDTIKAEMSAFVPRLRSLLESQLNYLASVEEEMLSMGLVGNGDPDSGDVESLAKTVETRADEAESRARDESARREEERVERREQIVTEHAAGAGHHAPSAGQTEAEAVHAGGPGEEHAEAAAGEHAGGTEGEHAEGAGDGQDREARALDRAMQAHHERQAEKHPPDSTWKPEPSEDGGGASGGELHIAHAPQEGESEKHGDAGA